MALSQLVTQTPGTLIKSGDWNNEFQNILTHPITLLSPTTGAINFNFQSHSNLLPNVITASSGTTGQALVVSGGATVWGTPTVSASGVTNNTGTTGQVFAITSSSTAPAFQVLPIDGGLSTFTPTAGMIYTISSSAAYLKGVTIGSSGQVLMVATSGLPTWQNMTTGGSGSGGGGFSTGSDITFSEDFLVVLSTNAGGGFAGQVVTSVILTSSSGGAPVFTQGMGYFVNHGVSSGVALAVTGLPGNGSGSLVAYTTALATGNGGITWGSQGQGSPYSFVSTSHYQFQSRWIWNSSASGTIMQGMSTDPVSFTSSGTGIYLSFATTNHVFLNCVASSAGATQGTVDSGVTSTAWHTYLVTVTSSEVALTVDGALIGSITSTSQIPNTPLSFMPMMLVNAGTSAGIIIDYLQIVSTKSVRP